MAENRKRRVPYYGKRVGLDELTENTKVIINTRLRRKFLVNFISLYVYRDDIEKRNKAEMKHEKTI